MQLNFDFISDEKIDFWKQRKWKKKIKTADSKLALAAVDAISRKKTV